ncbi:MAG: hypothetical protein JST36_07075 [Bacteroidetes bacterium]|nr:hypothetical protein [Bacteroidota bacterium]
MKTIFSSAFSMVILALALSACSGDANQPSNTTEAESAAANGFTPAATVPAKPHKTDTVIIKAMAFSPATITVQKGDTIYWINQDMVAHDISQYPDRKWHSALLQPGDHYVQTFDDSSSYFCSIHPTMLGKVLLQ